MFGIYVDGGEDGSEMRTVAVFSKSRAQNLR